MNVITHLLLTWSAADLAGLKGRDRTLVTWCGVLPDADGAGILLDTANRWWARPPTDYFGHYHHLLLHGLFAALCIPAVLCLFANSRAVVFLGGFAAVHLHLLCDLVGSRGPDPGDIWPIHYLGPFSPSLTLSWAGQWPLNAWPNVLLTLLLLLWVMRVAVVQGASPVSMFSTHADQAFVAALRNRMRPETSRPS